MNTTVLCGSIYSPLRGITRWAERESVRLLIALTIGLLMAGLSSGAVRAQEQPVPPGATVELVDDGFQFTEGPVWYEGDLLFSDIPANTVYKWSPNEETSVFMNPSGHSNGLAVDTSGHLLLAQHDGQVGRLTEDGSVATLADSYGGKRLNSPNDLTVASDGTIYFTDPPYGVDEEDRELSFSGVYRLSPDGDLTLLSKEFSRPNGICLSPDESTLYVNDSRETIIRAYDVTENGDIENGRLFARPQDQEAEGTTDGMKVELAPPSENEGSPTHTARADPDERCIWRTGARDTLYHSTPARVPRPRQRAGS